MAAFQIIHSAWPRGLDLKNLVVGKMENVCLSICRFVIFAHFFVSCPKKKSIHILTFLCAFISLLQYYPQGTTLRQCMKRLCFFQCQGLRKAQNTGTQQFQKYRLLNKILNSFQVCNGYRQRAVLQTDQSHCDKPKHRRHYKLSN